MTGQSVLRYRNLGRDRGLAAGLAAVLDGLNPAAAAPQRLAVLPLANVPVGVQPVPNRLAAAEGLALVRYPAHAAEATSGPGLTGPRAAALAAVRIGALVRLLEGAVERLSKRRFQGVPIIGQQLVVGAVADVVTECDLLVAALSFDEIPAEVAASHHDRLSEVGGVVARMYGAEGYLVDHPARGVHVSELVADVWIPRPVPEVYAQ